MANEPTDQFWVILHSLIRPDKATKEEVEQADAACAWLHERRNSFRDLLNLEEAEIIGGLADHWLKFGKAPALPILKHLALDRGDVKMQAGLDTYEAMRESLTRHPVADLDPLLAVYHEHVQTDRMTSILKIAAGITKDGRDLPDPKNPGKKIHYAGPLDALRYVESSVIRFGIEQADGSPVSTPDLDTGDVAGWLGAAREAYSPESGAVVSTGFYQVDNELTIRRGQLAAVAAHSGQGKSTLARSLAYGAISRGHRVLWIPLEQAPEEEIRAFHAIHAFTQFNDKARALDATARRATTGRLSAASREFLGGEVAKSFAALPGRLCVSSLQDRTIKGLLGLVSRKMLTGDFDVLVVDHPKCIPAGRDARAHSMELFTEIKGLASRYDLATIAPVQTNREGWKRAGDNGGQYDLASIYEDSACEHFADLIVGLYRDKELAARKVAKLSVVKARNGADLSPWDVSYRGDGGYYVGDGVTCEDVNLMSLDEL